MSIDLLYPMGVRMGRGVKSHRKKLGSGAAREIATARRFRARQARPRRKAPDPFEILAVFARC